MRRDSPPLADIAIEHGVRDERVIQAVKDVPRREFVPAPHALHHHVSGPVHGERSGCRAVPGVFGRPANSSLVPPP